MWRLFPIHVAVDTALLAPVGGQGVPQEYDVPVSQALGRSITPGQALLGKKRRSLSVVESFLIPISKIIMSPIKAVVDIIDGGIVSVLNVENKIDNGEDGWILKSKKFVANIIISCVSEKGSDVDTCVTKPWVKPTIFGFLVYIPFYVFLKIFVCEFESIIAIIVAILSAVVYNNYTNLENN